ncbi:MAG: hypothetical protein FWG47_04015, partial [Propionibacteriaceae bacterium]|nr:hypothetical protein [Propionibacteriaceae bacterium]
MGIIDVLDDPHLWNDFLQAKQAKLTAARCRDLAEFINGKKYQEVVDRIHAGVDFPLPTRREVNKLSSGKKRIVYTFPAPESQVLKLLTHQLYCYDHLQPAGCFSFRRGIGAHDAIRSLTNRAGI